MVLAHLVRPKHVCLAAPPLLAASRPLPCLPPPSPSTPVPHTPSSPHLHPFPPASSPPHPIPSQVDPSTGEVQSFYEKPRGAVMDMMRMAPEDVQVPANILDAFPRVFVCKNIWARCLCFNWGSFLDFLDSEGPLEARVSANPKCRCVQKSRAEVTGRAGAGQHLMPSQGVHVFI
jgi:hypothetical protein